MSVPKPTPEQEKIIAQVQSNIQPIYQQWIQHVISINTTKYNQIHNCENNKYLDSVEYKQWVEIEQRELPHQLYRFCTARKFNTKSTVDTLNTYYQWRINNSVDTILDSVPNIMSNDLIYKLTPHAFHGYTKLNQPIYYEKTGLINFDACTRYATLDEFKQYHIYRQEENILKCQQKTNETGQYVDTFFVVQDLTGLSMSARKALYILKEFVYIDQNYYCERMGKALVVCITAYVVLYPIC